MRVARFRFVSLGSGVVAWAFLGCGGSSEPGAPGAPEPPKDIAIDAVNLQLNGAFTPAETERRSHAIDAVAKLTSDIACVTEVFSDVDKDAIVAAARERFPYSFFARTNEATPFDDPRGLDGTVPALPTRPACESASSRAKLTELLGCLRDHCSAARNDDGTLGLDASQCLAEHCTSEATAMIFATAEDQACWTCAFGQLNGRETFRSVAERCATEVNPLSFRGQNGILLLSRFPIKDSTFTTYPSPLVWRAGMGRSVVTLPDGKDLDVYCGAMSPVQDCSVFPRSTPYGAPATDCREASTNVQRLQAQRIVELVDRLSGGGPAGAGAVIVGDFYTGPAASAALAAVTSPVFDALTRSLTLGVPDGYFPSCTYCRENPLIASGSNSALSSWTRFAFLRNLPVTTVQSTEVFGKEAVVPAVVYGHKRTVPLSAYYGLRTVLRITE